MLNELVCFENGSYGLVLNLESNSVGIVMLGKYDDILENSIVKRTKKIISIPVGDQLLGRIVNALGQEQDGKEKIKKDHLIPIEKIPFGVMQRKSVDEPLATGILAIDAMFPIGKGQRELIIGDRQTGKTTLAIDIIINQKDKNVKCVYVAIGQRESTILNVHQTLLKHNAMSYTTIVATTSSDLPSLLFLAPYAGITIAEH
jgi:F-type H+-transporting ATPase subunit alpha